MYRTFVYKYMVRSTPMPQSQLHTSPRARKSKKMNCRTSIRLVLVISFIFSVSFYVNSKPELEKPNANGDSPYIIQVTQPKDGSTSAAAGASSSHHSVPKLEIEKPDATGRSTYVIQVTQPKGVSFTTAAARTRWYQSLLPACVDKSRITFAYHEVFSGFAASLNSSELEAVKKIDDFLNAYPNVLVPLTTTRTATYLGLNPGSGLWTTTPPGMGAGTIVAVLDTGYVPGHPSFGDAGMPAAPKAPRWLGTCDATVTCNNKVIGARNFISGSTVVDPNGHGSHTASTAAGNFVNNASYFGLAAGTASGIAPRSYLAIYKVCGPYGCPTASIIAGMDRAVQDGADVLSLSLGAATEWPYYTEPTAIATFGAMKRGRFVSYSAGNDGLRDLPISNDMPWVLTVGASTLDRSLLATVRLGNDWEFKGETNTASGATPQQALIYPGGINAEAANCEPGTLAGINVAGRVVVCEVNFNFVHPLTQAAVVQRAGGVGLILTNDDLNDYTYVQVFNFPQPTIYVNFLSGNQIKAYAKSIANPTAALFFHGTVLGVKPSPMVASFSSKGPSTRSQNVLKPDILGPGVNILAAWPTDVLPNIPFNVISGTSMATPHLSGVAALLKSFHPTWSPAAIKSAILTTADFLDRTGVPIRNEHMVVARPFEIGSGHVNPTKANDPGLVYDLSEIDYTRFLCGLSYTDGQVSTIVGSAISCAAVGSVSQSNLNYPTITVPKGVLPVTVTRTVTNVGVGFENYTAVVIPPPGTNVGVNPPVLTFLSAGETKTFTVQFIPVGDAPADWASGMLMWTSPVHSVRSALTIAP